MNSLMIQMWITIKNTSQSWFLFIIIEQILSLFPVKSPVLLYSFQHIILTYLHVRCLLLFMHRHYLGLFRHAKSMLMAEHSIIDVFWGLYARRHLSKSQGREMKVGGIANIHPRQLFMNIKEQLWKVAGSHHFLLIISKHWNTLRLNDFVLRKVCDWY